jgi:hypothetical protein
LKHHFERVRIDQALLGKHPNRTLVERLLEDDQLLDQLAEIAAERGLPYQNILDARPRLKFTQQTCRAMIIPIEVLEYVLANDLPLRETLGIPDYVHRNHDDFGVRGEGHVIALKGAYISDGVRFETAQGSPIVLREQCLLEGELTIRAGTVIEPHQRVTGPNLFLPRPIR